MGFEPMVRSRESLVFKTSSINHSDTSPQWLPPECRYYYTKKRRGCQPFRAIFLNFIPHFPARCARRGILGGRAGGQCAKAENGGQSQSGNTFHSKNPFEIRLVSKYPVQRSLTHRNAKTAAAVTLRREILKNILQCAGDEAVLPQYLHLGVAQLFQLGGGFLKAVGQRLDVVDVGGQHDITGQHEPVF